MLETEEPHENIPEQATQKFYLAKDYIWYFFKKKLVGNMFLYLFAAMNSPSTCNAVLKENSSARLFNYNIFISIGM